MRVLLTGSNTAFGSALAEHLSALEGCELRLTDRTEQPGDPRTRLPDPFWLSQLDDSEATHALLDGVDQIIHAEPFAAGDMPLEDDAWCDIPSRCTYNLLHAAAEVGVSRVICLSSMAVFNSVDERYVVSANWQAAPRPTPAELGPHLAEFVCREFANSDAIPVAVARLGAPLDPDAVELGERPRFWVATEQAVEEVASLLFEQAPAPEAGDGNSGFFVGGGTANMFHPVVLTPPHPTSPRPLRLGRKFRLLRARARRSTGASTPSRTSSTPSRAAPRPRRCPPSCRRAGPRPRAPASVSCSTVRRNAAPDRLKVAKD